MLEKLILKRFQSHRQIEVDLNHPVTTIIGPNDSGKTALIRAIKWVSFNRPQGDEFIHNWTGTARAELIVDGHSIVRKRGKSNVYILDGDSMKSFLTDVPKPIKDLLNLTEENIQEQLDNPFWFSISPGQVSKELNQIVDLEIIDETLKRLASKSRQVKSEYELSGKRLKELKSQIKELKWVDRAESDLAEIANTEFQLGKLEKDILIVSDAILEIRTATSELGRLRAASAKAGKLRTKVEALEAVERDVNFLQTFIQESYELWQIQKQNEALRKLLVAECKVNELEDEIEALSDFRTQQLSLHNLKCELKEKQAEFAENMKGKCPLCQK